MFRDGVQVATPPGASALITGLAANTTYSFTVVAVNSFEAARRAPRSPSPYRRLQQSNFGPNVVIFDPSMPMSAIQSQINSIFAVQQNNQFGAPRTAMLFKPEAPTTSTFHRILHPHHRPGRVP